jgi:hypothetical protein
MSAGPDPEQWEQDDLDDAGLDIEVLRRRRERVLAILAVFGIIVVGIFVARAMFKPRPVQRAELIAAAKQAVRNAAPNDSVLVFSTTSEFVIEVVEANVYSVRGEVLLEDRDGHAEHFFFVCQLMRQAEGPWRPVRLSITPG